MRNLSPSTLTTAVLTGALTLFTLGTARAQAPAVYYYPASGLYQTTAGTVAIPAAGYYYNVPAAYAAAPYAAAPAMYYAPAPRVATYRPHAAYSSNPNNPPYYMGGMHSLHARGHDSSRHGQ
jgi:hypothetical protein